MRSVAPTHASLAQRAARVAPNGGEGPSTGGSRAAPFRGQELAQSTFRQRQRRSVGVFAQATVPAQHATDAAPRPNAAMRPASEAAVNSSVALQQFLSSGAANRERPPSRGVSPCLILVGATAKSRSDVAGYASEPKSSLVAIGLSIHNTPVALREKLATPESEWPRAIAELTSYPHIEEAAVLSTCNRFEVYVVAVSFNRGVREIEDWMSRVSRQHRQPRARARQPACGSPRR